MSDLMDKIKWLTEHDTAARAIGENGRALAERLTYERELERSVGVISSAFRYFRDPSAEDRPFAFADAVTREDDPGPLFADPETLWRRARELRAANEIDKAKALLRKGTIQFRDNFLPVEGLARISESAGNWREAEALWRKSISLNDAHWQSHVGLARALREQRRADEAEGLLIRVMDRVPEFAEALAVISEEVGSPHGRMSQPHLERLERLVMAQADKPEAGTRILLASAILAKERQDWPEYQRRLVTASWKAPEDLVVRRLLMEANELIPEHSGVAAAAAPSFDQEQLLLSFESLGGGRGVHRHQGVAGGCEFGFFQRRSGAEPLSLLRWASIEIADLRRAMDEDFIGIADGGEVDLCEQPAYDWRVWERTYNIQFDHTHLDRHKVSLEKARSAVRMRFSRLRRKLLDDLATGEKIFVYRVADDRVSPDEIEGLAASLSRHGRNRLLFVMHSETLKTEFTINHVRNDLSVAMLKPRRGAINHDAWLALCGAMKPHCPASQP